jgi:hypothetical protein
MKRRKDVAGCLFDAGFSPPLLIGQFHAGDSESLLAFPVILRWVCLNSADSLDTHRIVGVALNGVELAITVGGALPELNAQAGGCTKPVVVEPLSAVIVVVQ